MRKKKKISFWTLGSLGFLVLLALIWGIMIFFHLPKVSVLKTHYPIHQHQKKNQTPQVIFQKSRPASWVSLPEISLMAIGAVIVNEDWSFFSHKGYDLDEIRESIKTNFKKKRYARGASTITQQVAKNVFLNRDKTLGRKFGEFFLARDLEENYSKRKILEIYFNIVEWGNGIYGIKEASYFYFEKEPSQLNAKEGAFLAMLLPNPKKYSRSFYQKSLTKYASRVIQSTLRKMVKAHYLSSEEEEQLRSQPLSFEAQPTALVH